MNLGDNRSQRSELVAVTFRGKFSALPKLQLIQFCELYLAVLLTKLALDP
jgi:hypothetical protein